MWTFNNKPLHDPFSETALIYPLFISFVAFDD
jgi:hypothetical protein